MSTDTARRNPADAPARRAPLGPLLEHIAQGDDLTAIRALVEEGSETGEGGSIVAATGLFPFAVADLARRADAQHPLVVITPTTRSAEDIRSALSLSLIHI